MPRLRISAKVLLINLIVSPGLSRPLTLNEAYKLALEKTEARSIGESQVRQAQDNISEARSYLLPQLSLDATYTKREVENSSNSFVRNGEQTATKLALSQSLYSGGKDAAAIRALKARLTKQEQSALDLRVKLYTDVARRYYQMGSSIRDVENLNTTLKLTRERVVELQKRTKIGRSRAGEVLSNQAQVAVLQSQVEAARASLANARELFAASTGIRDEVTITEVTDSQISEITPKDLSFYLKKIEERPDILILTSDLEDAKAQVSVARAGHLPELSLTGNYYLGGTGTFQANDWDFGVTLALPLFEGGRVLAQVRSARESELQAEMRLREKKRQAEHEVRATYQRLVAALEQLKTLKNALVLSEKNYFEQNRDYRFSLVTNLDVLQALDTFQDTKRTFDRQKFETLTLMAELNASVALLP